MSHRQPPAPAAGLAALLLATTVLPVAALGAGGDGAGLSPGEAAGRAYLPFLWQGQTPFSPPYRHPALATAAWAAVEAFATAYPLTATFPVSPGAPPSAAGARQNIEAACEGFPDLPDDFGPGAHRQACREWVAGYLGLVAAAGLWREARASGLPAADAGWAGIYLDQQLAALEPFVYGPEALAGEPSHRDSRAAVWQNPLRAVDLALLAELLRQAGALEASRQARAEELLSALARQWAAAWWATGVQPSHGVTLTTLGGDAARARSLAGRPVAVTRPYTFAWDADHGNSPAEETAWMGAGVMLAARALGGRLPDGPTLYAAGRHYIDYSIAFGRLDQLHGGAIRSLNAETAGGPYGQRALWLENHAPDTPSIPYLGSTWHFIGMALLASDEPGAVIWPSFAPDVAYWEFLKRSVGETLRGPDGLPLLLLAPGRTPDYALNPYPDWVTDCGALRVPRQYVRYDGRAGPGPAYLSEVGVPAGIDLVTGGWPLLKMAADRGDTWYRGVWLARLQAIFAAYAETPPNPAWIACATAPWIGREPAFQWSRYAAALSLAALQADGFVLEPWHPPAPAPATATTAPTATVTVAATTAPSATVTVAATASPAAPDTGTPPPVTPADPATATDPAATPTGLARSRP